MMLSKAVCEYMHLIVSFVNFAGAVLMVIGVLSRESHYWRCVKRNYNANRALDAEWERRYVLRWYLSMVLILEVIYHGSDAVMYHLDIAEHPTFNSMFLNLPLPDLAVGVLGIIYGASLLKK